MKNILFILITTFLFLGCGSKKEIVKTSKSTKEKEVVIKRDSVYKKVVSLPIKEQVFISLKTNNKLVDSIVNLNLRNFYTSKISGSNVYTAKFDTINTGLKISASVSGNSKTEIQTDKDTTKKEKANAKRVESHNSRNGFSFNWWLFFICLLLILVIIVLIKYF